jgi:PKD repeat protein
MGRNLKPWMWAALAAALIPSCGGGGGGGGNPGVYPTTVPKPFANRTIGAAPLAVFFNAALPTTDELGSPVVQPGDDDYSSFTYAWDFGDGVSPLHPTWTTDGTSRNTDTGVVAAHVYESAGSYLAKLTLTDAAGTVHHYQQTITVTDLTVTNPGNVFYIAAAGNDANPGTQVSPWKTIDHVIANLASNSVYLFNRGDTFPVTSVQTINTPGPGIFGAYGAGALPIFQAAGTDTCFLLRQEDWRFMDLEVLGTGAASLGNGFTLNPQLSVHRNLFLRITSQDFLVPIGWSDDTPEYPDPHDGNAIVDCVIPSAVQNGIFVGGQRLAILGNNIANPTREHCIRVWQANRGVIAHNILEHPSAHALKLHGPEIGTGRIQTRFVEVSDNQIHGQILPVAIGPENTTTDEQLVDIVYERNRMTCFPTTQVGLTIWARRITARNNIFDGTGASSGFTAVSVEQRGYEPPSQYVQIYNNTVYRGDTATSFRVCAVQPVVSLVTLHNNLACCPPATTFQGITVGACPGFVAPAGDNFFVPATDFVAAGTNFKLNPGSAGIDGGVTLLWVRTAIDGTSRPQGAAFDVGAYEQ